MQAFVDVETFFERVFLVDLSPSLTAIAIDRFARLGWKNVEVVCQDARAFRLRDHYSSSHGTSSPSSHQCYNDELSTRPEALTLSYSLSMIPDFYPVIDALALSLAPHGIIGVADFYVQSEVEYHSRSYIGGELDRHCMWISRVFWRTWFEADRVNLEGARRVSACTRLMESNTDDSKRTIWSTVLGLCSA
jgi:betaine lipid synthase